MRPMEQVDAAVTACFVEIDQGGELAIAEAVVSVSKRASVASRHFVGFTKVCFRCIQFLVDRSRSKSRLCAINKIKSMTAVSSSALF